MPPSDQVHRQATRYNCKYCNAFVRNTPLEKRNHEATPRHQGNLQRFLRELHRTNERKAREEQRGKDEVARLNGTPRENSSAAGQQVRGPKGAAPPPLANAPVKASPEERRRQMAQLAAMGVVVPGEAVPDGFRRENAIPGEWQTVEVRTLPSEQEQRRPARRLGAAAEVKAEIKKEEGEEEDEVEDDKTQGLAGRKRKRDGDIASSAGSRKPPRWGHDVKELGGSGMDDDLDALLNSTSTIKTKREDVDGPMPKSEEESPPVKKEDGDEPAMIGALDADSSAAAIRSKALAKEEENGPDIGSLFKKKRPKSVRQK